MKFKKIAILMLSASLSITMMTPAVAATTQEQIEDVESQKADTQASLAEAQGSIDYLNSLKGNLESYLTELNAQYTQLTDSLQSLANQSKKKEAELVKVKAELKEAKRQEAEQYAAMKLRISYMYENSNTSALETLLSAQSFADFLNQAENFMEISNYDRDMLKKYQETKDLVAEKEKKVEQEQEAIAKLEAESMEKREEVAQLEEATKGEIASYQSEIYSKQSTANSLLALVNTQSAQLDSLVAQAEKEQEEAAKAQAEAQAHAAAEAEAAQNATKASQETEEDVSSDSAEEESSEDEEETTVDDTSSQDTASDSSSEETPEEDTTSDTSSQDTSSSTSGTYLGNFKLTAYCNCAQCCGTAGNQTASGTWPTAGRTVAMAGVPFGTKLSINGTIYTVEDLGTPYGHVDIYMGSHSEALSFGLQYADVYQVN